MRKGWIWLIAGTALAVWLSLIVVAWLPPRFDYQPTSDELFDRTMRWVMKERRRLGRQPSKISIWLDQNLSFYTIPEQQVDYSDLLDLEHRYADDPRYWQLLFQIGDTEGFLIGNSVYATHPLITRDGYYDKLVKGQYNTASFCLVPWNSPRVEDEALFAEMADSAIDSDPDNAFFYYCKADYVQQLGELEEALQLTRQGNSASENYRPLPFIRQELQEYGATFSSRESKEAAVILNSIALPNYIKIKERYKELCVGLALGLPLETADEYIARARRMGQAQNVSLTEQYVAAVLAYVLLDYVSTDCIDLDPEQQRELDAIVAMLDSVMAEADDIFKNNKLGAPLYAWKNTGMYSQTVYIDQASWDANMRTRPIVAKNRERFDILEPPPFAIWARGEQLGVDASGGTGKAGGTEN
jgi:hypothetical protein